MDWTEREEDMVVAGYGHIEAYNCRCLLPHTCITAHSGVYENC
jgi:hypothetical protein